MRENVSFNFKNVKKYDDVSTFSNQHQFSVVFILIDHRNDDKMCKNQVEPRAAGEWFHCKFLTSFLCPMRVKTMENCCRYIYIFFFTKIQDSFHFCRPIPLTFLGKSPRERENKLRHHHIMSMVCIIIDHRDQVRVL